VQSAQPIIVRVLEEPVRTTSAADVLIGALGLAVVLALSALALGAVLGGLLIGYKRLRAKYDPDPLPDSEALRVTPSSSTP
jgi:hypothetical protein